jgi:short-subunit dehydrogenase
MTSRNSSIAALLGLGLAGFLAGRAAVRYSRRIKVAGKVAVITGGSRGIGLQVAHELARKGAKLLVCARDEGELRLAQEDLERHGGDVLAVTCDVTSVEQVGNVVYQAIERFGQVDILVTCAGIIVNGPVSHMKLDDFRRVMDVNFFGTLNFILAVAPEMRRRREGRIVAIGSLGGVYPAPHSAPYAASKFAVVGLTETLRSELQNNGIYVTTVNPGFVRDGAIANAQFKGNHEAEKSLAVTASNLPLMTIDPRLLAKRIVNALEHGDADLTTPLIPKLQARFHGAMPTLSGEILAIINRLLPHRDGNGGDRAREGADISDELAPAWARRRQRNAESKFQHTNPRTA